jgi:4-hydroxy-tetrahydrodipicolinate synthase
LPATSAGTPLRETISLSAALVTPFDDRGYVDWDRFAAHAGRLLAGGMSVVTAFGTTGEGVSIDIAQRAELYARTSERGIRPAQLVECVYGPSAVDAGRHVARSLSAGCAGILLTPPFYFKGVGDDGVFDWYAQVFETAGAACRDVILYNIPSQTGVTIGAELTGRLRQAFPQIIAGVKDSGGDWDHTAQLLAEHSDLAILVGHEGHLARAVRKGAKGAISGIANIAPALVGRLVRGEDDPRIELLLASLLRLPVVPAIKALVAIQAGDPNWRRVLAPLQILDDADAKRLHGETSTVLVS